MIFNLQILIWDVTILVLSQGSRHIPHIDVYILQAKAKYEERTQQTISKSTKLRMQSQYRKQKDPTTWILFHSYYQLYIPNVFLSTSRHYSYHSMWQAVILCPMWNKKDILLPFTLHRQSCHLTLSKGIAIFATLWHWKFSISVLLKPSRRKKI